MNGMSNSFPLGFLGGGLGGGEILLVLVVILVLFGSKNLPRMARNLGKVMEDFKRASRQVTQELMREDPDPPPPRRPVLPKTLPPQEPTAPDEHKDA